MPLGERHVTARSMTQSKQQPNSILAPISIGELIDKITILEIKAERISDDLKLRNITIELDLLRAIAVEAGLDTPAMRPNAEELKAINAALWEIEDEIRELEKAGDFGARFIELARSVYKTNDHRARVKQRINVTFGSGIIEEKSYKGS
jgi:uncharacterized protein DUF6165